MFWVLKVSTSRCLVTTLKQPTTPFLCQSSLQVLIVIHLITDKDYMIPLPITSCFVDAMELLGSDSEKTNKDLGFCIQKYMYG